MMFQLNRVNYDFKNQKLVKDNSRFEFDKTIYLDLFLNKNKDKAYKHYERLEKMKQDLKVLKETQSQYSCETSPAAKEKAKLVDLINCCESIMSKGTT